MLTVKSEAQADFLPSLVTESDLSTELDPKTEIIPLGNYLLLYWPNTGAYQCRRFDPFSSTLMLAAESPQNLTGKWRTIKNAELIPVAGYVVSRYRHNGECHTWMFDGGNASNILPGNKVTNMQWTIEPSKKLCTLGDRIVAWSPSSRDITLWPVDPTQALIGMNPGKNSIKPNTQGRTLTIQPQIQIIHIPESASSYLMISAINGSMFSR
nr:hypothetical protein [Xenorhabdus sp. ZM]